MRRITQLRKGRAITSWWCGPDRSWGHTFGPLLDVKTNTLSMSVAVFSTRREAREAMALVGLVGCEPVSLEIALCGELSTWRRAS